MSLLVFCIGLGLFFCLAWGAAALDEDWAVALLPLAFVFLVAGMVGAIMIDNTNRDNFRQLENANCRAAGGAYVVITAGDAPDLCVNNQNVILNPGWMNR